MNYKKHYDLLIEKANKRTNLEGYIEKHHIVPKCMGGTNTSENLVKLTAREHYVSHVLLHKTYPKNNKLAYAILCMFFGKRKKYLLLSSRDYEKARVLYSKAMSGKGNPCFGRTGDKHPMYGKFGKDHPRTGHKNSAEVRKKHSVAMSGEGNSMYGKHHSPKAKNLISEGNKKRFENYDLLLKNRQQKTCISVIIDGKEYQSFSEASRQLHIIPCTISSRCRSINFKNYQLNTK